MREAVSVPTYLPPGVYVERDEPGGAIEGVSTAIAAFIGFTQIGPFNSPRLVTSWSAFSDIFGGFTENSYLPRAVCGYFDNGGTACYVVRVGAGTLAAATHPETALASRPPRPSDFVGSDNDGTGLRSLEALDGVSIVCAPDVMMALQQGWFDLDAALFVQRNMVAHCERRQDRLAILDAPPNFDQDQISRWRSKTAAFDSAYATLYWPWLKMKGASTGADPFVPPSGHVAGIWARNDATRGVQKAPANAEVRGSIDVAINVTQKDQALLNPLGINCLRALPVRGIRVLGARTLSSDSQWRYVNVRRVLNYLEQSIINGTSWIASTPNDAASRATLREQVTHFLLEEWRKGTLFGSSPDSAFFVTCDDTTSDPDENRARSVTLEVGVTPVKPREFFTFSVTHSLRG